MSKLWSAKWSEPLFNFAADALILRVLIGTQLSWGIMGADDITENQHSCPVTGF